MLMLYTLPDVEFVGRVGEALEFPQCFELFPDFDDVLQQSSVPLLFQVTELTCVSDGRYSVEPIQCHYGS